VSEFKTVRGMRDLLPEEARLLRFVEASARTVARLYGYREIITPVVESYELLSAKAGEEVKSRMFTFKDLGGRDVALRPEFTASVARLVASTLRAEPKPFRLFCTGSIYRYDEPQRGRYREFWQSNYELMGSSLPEADAEILLLTDRLMRETGLSSYAMKIGHVGVLRGIFAQEKLDEKVQNAAMQLMDKKQYDNALNLIMEAGFSDDGLKTLRELIVLRGDQVFEIIGRMNDCVSAYGQAVESVENLAEIVKLIVESEARINLNVDAGFARGLEYYTGMISEIYVPELEIALGGGGRYDRLIEIFGGEPTPAVGIAHGMDRMMLTLKSQKTHYVAEQEKTVIVIPIQEQLKAKALEIAQMLREAGITTELEISGRKMGKALEDANRRKLDYAVLVGEREVKEGSVVVRDLVTRNQKTVKTDTVVKTIRSR
jgi:histidyl-tRNA synthetase